MVRKHREASACGVAPGRPVWASGGLDCANVCADWSEQRPARTESALGKQRETTMQTVKEKPILFSAPMVRAILEGRKTQTRRIVRYPRSWLTPYASGDKNLAFGLFHTECGKGSFWNCGNPTTGKHHWQCADERLPQNYQVGSRLWVKETFRNCGLDTPRRQWEYRADESREDADMCPVKWTPSIFMPRKASRITLEITGVRVERLHDISEEDAKAEGIGRVNQLGILRCSGWKDYSGLNPGWMRAVDSYRTLWESINGPGSWSANPWVWVISFKRL